MNNKILYGVIACMFIGMCAMGVIIHQQQNYIKSLHTEVASLSYDVTDVKDSFEQTNDDAHLTNGQLTAIVNHITARLIDVERETSYLSSHDTGYSDTYLLESRISDLEMRYNELERKLRYSNISW